MTSFSSDSENPKTATASSGSDTCNQHAPVSGNPLGSVPVGKLMARLAMPSIAAQVINILYNVVDRIYIGHIPGAGSLALTGLGICFPVLMVISAFSSFAGAGGAPLAAIELGKSEKDPAAAEKAESILNNACLMLVFFSVVLTAVFFSLKKPLLCLFGASSNTLPYADTYLSTYLLGTVFVQLALGLNPFISAQGHARTAMCSVLIGALTNIVLDPVFIFGLQMGVQGAAVATVISQALSALWIISFLCSKKTSLRLRPSIKKFSLRIVSRISSLGISPFIMQSTESAIFIVFNSGLQKYGGDLYVGTMTVMQSLMQMCLVPVQGFTYGVQPIISYNFGAGKFDRVRSVLKRMTLISVCASVVCGLSVSLHPVFFARIFSNDAALLAVIDDMLPVYFGAVWIFGVQMSAQSSFVALGKAKTSLCIALLRKVVLLIPLAYLFPVFFGVNGIYWAEPVASTISAVTAGILFVCCYRRELSVVSPVSRT